MSRNPRRAYDKDGREIPPATMANIREQGINTLWATCQRIGCGHEAKVDASRFPDDMPVPDVGLAAALLEMRRAERLHHGRLVGERLAQALRSRPYGRR